jgi:glycosyltransferase involved in cell wall biosynthesis
VRFHVPALPGRPTTRENSHCAYSGYVRKFCRMMRDAGHEVVLYGGGANDAPVSEYVECYGKVAEPVGWDDPAAWREFNLKAAGEIAARADMAEDFLCLISGDQRGIAEALPEMLAAEYRVGYGGTCTQHRVFETYAWMHTVYGHQEKGNVNNTSGLNYDAVIYPPFEKEDFPKGAGDGEYLLYLGRLIQRKGIEEAVEAATRAGKQLILAGEGDYRWGEDRGGVDFIGPVGPEERGALLGKAEALLAPTLYVEPGGGSSIEAMMCGTPVISTDWGSYSETVRQGVDGFRCRTLGEMVWAAEHATELSRTKIRRDARARFSLEVIGPEYESYFGRLATLRDAGWYADWVGLKVP